MLRYADGTPVMVGDEVCGIEDYKNHWTELLDDETGIVTDVNDCDMHEELTVEVRTKRYGLLWMDPSDLLTVRYRGSITFDETEFLSMIE